MLLHRFTHCLNENLSRTVRGDSCYITFNTNAVLFWWNSR